MSPPLACPASAPKPPEGSTEEELVRCLKEGDRERFTGLVERHHQSLLRLARLFVASHEVAEEVVQETWVAVLRGLGKFEGRSSIKTWIFRILTNRARTRGAREARTLPFSAVSGRTEEPGPSPELERFGPRASWIFQGRRENGGSPEQAVLDQETLERVLGHMRKLPPKQGAVVYLRDVKLWSAPEVCEAMKITDIYQRVLLHRARSRIRSELERERGQAGPDPGAR